MNAPRRVIFDETRHGDPPALHVSQDLIISSPNGVYSLKWVKLVLNCYMIFLILEYVCFFIGLPFEEVENRPGFVLLSEIYMLWVVLVSIFLLPLGSSTVPYKSAYISHLASALLQLGCVGLNFVSVVLTFKSYESFTIPVFSKGEKIGSINVQRYTEVCTTLSFAISVITFILSLINCVNYGKALYRMANRLDRREIDPVEYLYHGAESNNHTNTDYPDELATALANPSNEHVYLESDLLHNDEVVKQITRSFH